MLVALGFATAMGGLSGCAGDPEVRPWWTLGEAAFRQIQPGRSTKGDVRNLLGKAILETTFQRLREDVWDYRYLYGAVFMYATVHFDERGVVKHVASEPDQAYYGGGPDR